METNLYPEFSAMRTQLETKIKTFRKELNSKVHQIDRVAIAIYCKERDVLHTYAFDEDRPSELTHYEAKFTDSKSLYECYKHNEVRIVEDLSANYKSPFKHSQTMINAGFQSSFCAPLRADDDFLGFFFADSRHKSVFTAELVEQLKLISMVVSLLLKQDKEKIHVLRSTVESMRTVSDYRDPETGEHLLRMSNYSLLIARHLADSHHLNDVQIDYIYLYSVLHDIGKITVPDEILLKPGKLTAQEFERMKLHASEGFKLAEYVIDLYDLKNIPHISILLNIIKSHHEKIDGSGYPEGLKGDQVPLESRIIAVADIFDALTCERPYKKAWTNEAAFAELTKLVDEHKIDGDCVNALKENQNEIAKIQKEYKDKHS